MTQPTPTQKKRPYRNEDHWRELIDAFESSNLSVADYCEQNHLKYTTFYKWRKRLQQTQDTRQSLPFVEITDIATTASAKQSSWDIELELGSNTFLRIRRT